MTTRAFLRAARSALVAAGILVAGACSTTGSNELTCVSNEVAPHTQPGSPDGESAFEWYLENNEPDADRDDYELASGTDTREVYSDGRNQISVSALPSDEDQEPVWVVLITYECS